MHFRLALWRVLSQQQAIVIDCQTAAPKERFLLSSVARLARQAQLPARPEVAIYPSCHINAHASGPWPGCALIEVSTALLDRLQPRQIEAVLAHEIAHIGNRDILTASLVQGALMTGTLFSAQRLAAACCRYRREEPLHEESSARRRAVRKYIFIAWLCENLLTLFASILLAAFCHQQELQADQQAAVLVGAEKMIAALRALQATDDSNPQHWLHSLLATHPPLQERIQRLAANSVISSQQTLPGKGELPIIYPLSS